jgi:hypothetical protein
MSLEKLNRRKTHQCALACPGVIDDRLRVVHPQPQTAGREFDRLHGGGKVDVRIRHSGQFGQVAADELPVRIEAFATA